MQGMDHAQRSNAVGSMPSYLPDGDPGRQGGNTYTGGNSTEPTIQDYENIFGPSARDIKTDLQRFKRHGRWHLPDVLKGPNPWLTDRIDGLITDATNSPFTTKLLPYLYKEDVDGKMKWNVWSFDEGMASRVPYESAARTLTQSKRSFSGYMVRQGMAIVLEHNFMMSPAGRENFKNQLNQLIGSIQYTNDLDVHMALILAPSHAKTMRERYYSLDKSPSQICREFVDLFGMMQKNVNALDILIEEGKAILRTWGGPMPDFLLCNSKLTFQMTMNPEKTNYITQGVDGIKRLKQGPDLSTYRGLSIIHSRSFSMETGQAPRDVLRRRVRTAEYYRIPPSKKNLMREFELYNEERDTWFTLSFLDLLRYAIHENHDGDGHGRDNASKLHRIYHALVNSQGDPGTRMQGNLLLGAGEELGVTLGARRSMAENLTATEVNYLRICTGLITNPHVWNGLESLFNVSGPAIQTNSAYHWRLNVRGFDLGVKHLHPQHSKLWVDWERAANAHARAAGVSPERLVNSLSISARLKPSMAADLFESMRFIPLNDPFHVGNIAAPGTTAWFMAYSFYLETYKRGGVAMDYFADLAGGAVPASNRYNSDAHGDIIQGLQINHIPPAEEKTDITAQFLSMYGAVGSVNSNLFMLPLRFHNHTVPQAEIPTIYTDDGVIIASKLIMTYEILGPLLREYNVGGRPISGIEYLSGTVLNPSPAIIRTIRNMARSPTDEMVHYTSEHLAALVNVLGELLDGLPAYDRDTPDHVYLARAGINTWPMGLTTLSHFAHPSTTRPNRVFFRENTALLESSYGHINHKFVEKLAQHVVDPTGAMWVRGDTFRANPYNATEARSALISFIATIRERIFSDPYLGCKWLNRVQADGAGPVPRLAREKAYLKSIVPVKAELNYLDGLSARLQARETDAVVSSVAPAGLQGVVIDMDRFFQDEPPNPGPPTNANGGIRDRVEDVEIVIVRPNIEHNMLGVIMGLGGSELGHTLWGQTELSVYDDSMHGIWGMSYKYHERAIVFNEKNLIRLWDIAYDGYNGGKDDTYVDWTNEGAANGYKTFQCMTMDVSKNYRGPSMMVMAFVHDRDAKDDGDGKGLYDKHFVRNWPSPIVFHDSYRPSNASAPTKETLPLDYDNLQVVDVEQFRVFNNDLYHGAYSQYHAMMPAFHEMHMMRKSAGQSSADSETHTDSLAFQGSMRIKELGRGVVEEIHGSGHHGPDYSGVASVRAGKGQKVAGAAPTLHRLI